jgi:hypothetical protein
VTRLGLRTFDKLGYIGSLKTMATPRREDTLNKGGIVQIFPTAAKVTFQDPAKDVALDYGFPTVGPSVEELRQAADTGW